MCVLQYSFSCVVSAQLFTKLQLQSALVAVQYYRNAEWVADIKLQFSGLHPRVFLFCGVIYKGRCMRVSQY